MTLVLLCATGFALSAVLTGAVRRYAITRQVLDVPNPRSSHTIPTPRGGGVAIVVVFLASLTLARATLAVPAHALVAVVGSGIAMAVLGFLDDHRPIPAGWRLLCHFAGAAWALVWLGNPWIAHVFGPASWLEWPVRVLSAFGLVWLLNLYNFMDGIDGIASLEAITVSMAAAILWFVAHPSGAWPVPLLLAACTAGFLVWNFPPARIFMGDAGSSFLGMAFGVLALVAAVDDSRMLWAWGILLGAFIVDATVTLVRRLMRRERVHQAHRSHAYQYASRKHGGHRPVTLVVAGINSLWLFPMAATVVLGWLPGPLAVALAYFPLVLLAVRYKAGACEQQESA